MLKKQKTAKDNEIYEDNEINKHLLYKLENHFTDAVILDVETTGLATGNEDLEKNKEITNISIIDAQTGENIFTSFVKPKHPISQQLAIVNIINNEIVEDAPSFAEIYDKIVEATKHKKIIGWNIQFDITTIIEEAAKLNREYMTDAEILGYEDGMGLAMKATKLFPNTYNTAMFWKQDEACRLFDSYIYNANEIEELCGNTNHIDHIKDLEDYIDNAFDEKYRQELHEQLGSKEMHLAYCDNKEYRLTMMKAIQMYKNGEPINKDRFLSCLMTSNKVNKYTSAFKKEKTVTDILEKVKSGKDINELRDEYAQDVGGLQAFDNILLNNRKSIEKAEIKNNPFKVSDVAYKSIINNYTKTKNYLITAKQTGYPILTVRYCIDGISKTKKEDNKNSFVNTDIEKLAELKQKLNTAELNKEILEDPYTLDDFDEKAQKNYDNLKKQIQELENKINNNNDEKRKNEEKKEEELKEKYLTSLKKKLEKSSQSFSSEIVENLNDNEKKIMDEYIQLKIEEKACKDKAKYCVENLKKGMKNSKYTTKVSFVDPKIKIMYNPYKVSSSFSSELLKKHCPDMYNDYLKRKITTDDLQKLKNDYPQKVSQYTVYTSSSTYFDEKTFRKKERELFNQYSTIEYNKATQSLRFNYFGETEIPTDLYDHKYTCSELISEIVRLKEREDRIKSNLSRIDSFVMDILTNHDCSKIDSELGRVSLSKPETKPVFDSGLFKAENNDIYNYFVKTTPKEHEITYSINNKTVNGALRDKKCMNISIMENEVDANRKLDSSIKKNDKSDSKALNR